MILTKQFMDELGRLYSIAKSENTKFEKVMFPKLKKNRHKWHVVLSLRFFSNLTNSAFSGYGFSPQSSRPRGNLPSFFSLALIPTSSITILSLIISEVVFSLVICVCLPRNCVKNDEFEVLKSNFWFNFRIELAPSKWKLRILVFENSCVLFCTSDQIGLESQDWLGFD